MRTRDSGNRQRDAFAPRERDEFIGGGGPVTSTGSPVGGISGGSLGVSGGTVAISGGGPVGVAGGGGPVGAAVESGRVD